MEELLISEVEFWFNVVACITSYAVPLFGIVYWYMSVPFFLKRRALTTLVASRYVFVFLEHIVYRQKLEKYTFLLFSTRKSANLVKTIGNQ